MSEEYCTVGDDGYLRLWNVHTRKQTLCLDMKAVSRCCCYSPDGNTIAVGYGGAIASGRGGGNANSKGKEDGIVRVYRIGREVGKGKEDIPISFQLLTEIKEAKRWISAIKYSPDGTILAVGARDNSIYLYSASQQFKRKAKFSKHNAGINQFDFTSDGKAIQSCCRYVRVNIVLLTNILFYVECFSSFHDNKNRFIALQNYFCYICFLIFTFILWSASFMNSIFFFIFISFNFNFSAYEILFSDATTGSQLTQGATSLYGADWSTWTMTVGWAVQVCSSFFLN